MKINYSFVEFHSPVFSQGKNHGTKLHAGERTGIELFYDYDFPHVKMNMKYKGKITHFDSYHTADVIIEEFKAKIPAAYANGEEVKPVSSGVVFDNKKPHHASKEGKALRAQASQGE